MRGVLFVVLWVVSVAGLGCGGSDCSCSGGPPVLGLRLSEPVPLRGSVQVCFEATCGQGELVPEGTRDAGSVPISGLGRWEEHKDQAVTVRVWDRHGRLVTETSLVPEEGRGCCGDYWVAST